MSAGSGRASLFRSRVLSCLTAGPSASTTSGTGAFWGPTSPSLLRSFARWNLDARPRDVGFQRAKERMYPRLGVRSLVAWLACPAEEQARFRGACSLSAASRRLRLYELACLVHDDFPAGGLRRVRERCLEVLLAHPVGRDTG